ncbi:MAG: glycoside hydrolase family 38 C-terminal domain-containing protein [Clostridium sp.]|uniref:glycoside hydrolase family 38 N-terminal domain-containing protein n=1 Tax=Clostridium sp. TaxID=1506 RepID=UPI002907E054|nr:glycoside hydrolase family 38 C-terminal domain-containing protein [Clostridium sp.]MDU5109796.1 glycoside hydrolase family 38 C-terminal domain-containing protein [Clostridium sp.]
MKNISDKATAHVLHHTHWDNEWYFSEQDSLIQFIYHMDELIEAFDNNEISKFFLDGQTAILDDYLKAVPNSIEKVKSLIKDKKLSVGPFHTQPDCFISSAESIINNLRLGIETGEKYGGVSKVAYLPDSFGHSQDFPKIFKGMGIDSFVFRRGIGDKHKLPIDFYWKSNDGSEVLSNVEICGYGFATESFMDGTLNKENENKYDGRDVHDRINQLLENSRLENEFLLPIGEDQTPVLKDFNRVLNKYNKEDGLYSFVETTLEEYMNRLRDYGKNIPNYTGEIIDTQYNRVHKSIFSARSDIKALQDKIERLMTYEVQPLMAMLDKVGIEYKKEVIDIIWDLLVRSQTHSSATNTDETNELIFERTKKAYNLAHALKIYLARKIAISVGEQKESLALSQCASQGKGNNIMPLVIFNTLPYERDIISKISVYTKNKDFKIQLDEKDVNYSIVKVNKSYSGVIRKDESLMDKDNYFYTTDIIIKNRLKGLSYETLQIIDGEKATLSDIAYNNQIIENNIYRIDFNNNLVITNKVTGEVYNNPIYFEESGDEGDNYDYSYPDNDMINKYYLDNIKLINSYTTNDMSELTVEGEFLVPKDLESRMKKDKDSTLIIKMTLRLRNNSNVIECYGKVKNSSKNHRVRLVVDTKLQSKSSYAGTQFGVVERETEVEELKIWKKENWSEEPSPTNPLLNYVALKDENKSVVVYTRSSKEYEIIGEDKSDIAITLFRSVGHFGLPDLNRRPGRASGLLNKIIEAPQSQMIGDNSFHLGISFGNKYNRTNIAKDYVNFAVDPVYYQSQLLERVVYPISYFGTNPLDIDVSEKSNLIDLVDSNAIFSTFKKSSKGDSYILRIYNNEDYEIDGGKLEINFEYDDIKFTNIMENEDIPGSIEIGKLKPGEIRNIKILI